jgi:transposase InsO family protein
MSSCNKASSNVGIHASFQTVFLEAITDKKAHLLIEKWRLEYNTLRLHSSMNNHLPTSEMSLN